jgi:hypothetical protein
LVSGLRRVVPSDAVAATGPSPLTATELRLLP